MSIPTIVDETDEEAVALILGDGGYMGMPPGGRVMAFRDEQGICGGWLFERYTGPGGSIHTHWAGRDGHWLKKWMLNLAAIYVFDQLKCSLIYGEVKGKKLAVQAIDERLGFVEVARLKNYYPNDDLIIYEMKRENCDWLPEDFKEDTADGRGRKGRRTRGAGLESPAGQSQLIGRAEPGLVHRSNELRKGPVH